MKLVISVSLGRSGVFFGIDLLWIGVLAKDFYRNSLGHLFRENINWAAALIFYCMYIIGILIFAALPALEKQSLGRAVVMGGLFGFFTYATYDLTNFATLRDWPIKIVIVDITWGMV